MMCTRVRQFMCLKDSLLTVILVRRLEAGRRRVLLHMASQRTGSQHTGSQHTGSHHMVNLRTTNRIQRLQQDVKHNAVSRTDSHRLFKNLELLRKSPYPRRPGHNHHLRRLHQCYLLRPPNQLNRFTVRCMISMAKLQVNCPSPRARFLILLGRKEMVYNIFFCG